MVYKMNISFSHYFEKLSQIVSNSKDFFIILDTIYVSFTYLYTFYSFIVTLSWQFFSQRFLKKFLWRNKNKMNVMY